MDDRPNLGLASPQTKAVLFGNQGRVAVFVPRRGETGPSRDRKPRQLRRCKAGRIAYSPKRLSTDPALLLPLDASPKELFNQLRRLVVLY